MNSGTHTHTRVQHEYSEQARYYYTYRHSSCGYSCRRSDRYTYRHRNTYRAKVSRRALLTSTCDSFWKRSSSGVKFSCGTSSLHCTLSWLSQ